MALERCDRVPLAAAATAFLLTAGLTWTLNGTQSSDSRDASVTTTTGMVHPTATTTIPAKAPVEITLGAIERCLKPVEISAPLTGGSSVFRLTVRDNTESAKPTNEDSPSKGDEEGNGDTTPLPPTAVADLALEGITTVRIRLFYGEWYSVKWDSTSPLTIQLVPEGDSFGEPSSPGIETTVSASSSWGKWGTTTTNAGSILEQLSGLQIEGCGSGS